MGTSHPYEINRCADMCSFGEKIKKFAMSFEFEEEKLARPPMKDDQQAITTFWGIYPWPYTKYNRYAHLEGLEQTADETKTMATAFRHITRASELGLSMDGGLGFLNGPDINSRVHLRANRPSVFGQAKYVPEPAAAANVAGKQVTALPIAMSANERRYIECERMCKAAGYSGDELRPAIDLLLRNDHVWLENAINSRATQENSPSRARVADSRGEVAFDPDEVYNADDDDERTNTTQPLRRMTHRLKPKTTPKVEWGYLNPKELTNPQKEMLLEIEWAQRAFLQSYTIAIIDNATVFNQISKLTIARLPSRHLPLLRREDFWNALPNVSRLSLAIIPDWRDVVKEPTGWVQDNKLAPSLAVTTVYQLLYEQIARRRNITELHFEWICGGEYSPGMYSRNQHVLPMPVVSYAAHMVDRSTTQPVLKLPHIKHLKMKNCWSSPHIMRRFIAGLQQSTLESLTFDSVSLTTNIPQGGQPGPQQVQQPLQNLGAVAANLVTALQGLGPQVLAHQQGAGQATNANPNVPAQQQYLGPGAALPAALPTATTASVTVHNPALPPAISVIPLGVPSEPDWLQPPWFDSWVSIINDITPGRTLEQIRWTLGFSEEPKPRTTYRLKKLDFTSCGYVTLPLDFDQHFFNNQPVLALPNNVARKVAELDLVMMKASDNMLGKIANCIHPREVNAMQNAFNLTVGWLARGQDRAELVLDCELDGFVNAGHGRFDGVITTQTV